MQRRRMRTASLVLLMGAVGASPLAAAGRVELELVGDTRGTALIFQEWARTLGKAGIRNVRIRSSRASDRVGIEVRGTEDSPLYVVTGVIRSRDELLLPSGKFKQSDMARLALWLENLARHGPGGGGGGGQQKSAFGLSPQQFEQVQNDLKQATGFSTRDMTRDQAVGGIGRRLTLPIQIDPEARRALQEDKVAEELSTLSCGTSLAYVLRPMGLCLVPRQQGGRLVCEVVEARPGLEVWPVGWEPDEPEHDVLPALFKFHNINIQGVSAAKALEAIGRLLKVPVLIDHNALARHGIDPSKVTVAHPGRRTTYGLALKRILFQAGLKSEVRVDEAGRPFLWISTVKPV